MRVLDATPYSTIPDGSLIPCMSILVKGDRALLHKCALPNLCLTNRPAQWAACRREVGENPTKKDYRYGPYLYRKTIDSLFEHQFSCSLDENSISHNEVLIRTFVMGKFQDL